MLSSLADHFGKLQETSQIRMSRLEEALKMAQGYEGYSEGFDKWLLDAEEKKAALDPLPIASQPLKAKIETLQVYITYLHTVY